MVDRATHSSSHIPIPISKSPKSVHNGKFGSEIVQVLTSESKPMDSNGFENGVKSVAKAVSPSPKFSKVPKIAAPKELLIDKGKAGKTPPEKGFETFLMTGDMIIKTNPSLKINKFDGSGLERHHSDSTPCDYKIEKRTFKRSASSPDQTTFTGATVVLASDNVTMDNITKALDNEDDSSMNRKESAESGFDEQAIHSDTGTLEKIEKLPNDPTSVSDLSEVDSDDLLGNGIMVGSQSSATCDVSTVSTPSDLRSDISVNTVLQQEVEPLLKDDSSSSSSIDISSTESFSGELTPEMVFERSLSDSGGMSPVYNQHDVAKSLISSKSAEKIILQRQLRQKIQDPQGVRASKSQEQYVGEDLTFVSIDIEDTAYSLDQIPQPADQTPTTDNVDSPVAFDFEPASASQSAREPDPNDDRIFMPAFVKLDKSVHENLDDSKEKDECSDQFESVMNRLEYTDDESDTISDDDAQTRTQEFDVDTGALSNDTKNISYNGDHEEFDERGVVMNQDDLFALPPAKSVDHPSAKRLAKRLYNLDGFRKSDVSRHLSKK